MKQQSTVKTWRDSRLLGTPFVRRQNEAVLVIGKDSWTRQQMVDELKCGNFRSARILTEAARNLNVRDTNHMADVIALEDLFTQRNVGVTTIFTWMCVLAAKKHNPLLWLNRSPEDMVTIHTEKMRFKNSLLGGSHEGTQSPQAQQ